MKNRALFVLKGLTKERDENTDKLIFVEHSRDATRLQLRALPDDTYVAHRPVVSGQMRAIGVICRYSHHMMRVPLVSYTEKDLPVQHTMRTLMLATEDGRRKSRILASQGINKIIRLIPRCRCNYRYLSPVYRKTAKVPILRKWARSGRYMHDSTLPCDVTNIPLPDSPHDIGINFLEAENVSLLISTLCRDLIIATRCLAECCAYNGH